MAVAVAECETDWLDTGLAFTALDGSPLHPSHVTDQCILLAREADVPPIRLHDLRHGTAPPPTPWPPGSR